MCLLDKLLNQEQLEWSLLRKLRLVEYLLWTSPAHLQGRHLSFRCHGEHRLYLTLVIGME